MALAPRIPARRRKRTATGIPTLSAEIPAWRTARHRREAACRYVAQASCRRSREHHRSTCPCQFLRCHPPVRLCARRPWVCCLIGLPPCAPAARVGSRGVADSYFRARPHWLYRPPGGAEIQRRRASCRGCARRYAERTPGQSSLRQAPAAAIANTVNRAQTQRSAAGRRCRQLSGNQTGRFLWSNRRTIPRRSFFDSALRRASLR